MFRTGARIDSTTLTRRNPVGNDLVTDKEDLLRIWASYFTELSQSKIDESEDLQLLSNKMESLYEASLANEEHLLDTPFTVEDLEQTLGKLKMRRQVAQMVSVRNISSWAVLFTWLLKTLNSIIELEAIPSTLKCGSITPIYKGGGKDPLDQNSYRGITVASVMAKVLEYLILGRLNTVLLEVGVTHVNQTA